MYEGKNHSAGSIVVGGLVDAVTASVELGVLKSEA